MIGVLDYGIGNIGSILNMLKKANAIGCAVTDAETLTRCEKLILPGVGAFDEGVRALSESGMREALDAQVRAGVPLLGICLGMQMLGRGSEEGNAEGLGYLAFENKRFCMPEHPELKVPHMGWNEVCITQSEAELVRDLPPEPRFYFVHSYHAVCDDTADILMTCDYGAPFTAAVHHGNVWGTQFHPEKSHRYGMALLGAFAKRC